MHIQWNPWHGCHKCSAGCKNCFVFYFDQKRGRNSELVTRSKTNFNLPLKKDRNGAFKIPSGCEVATCFTTDFFIEEADEWRKEAWSLIAQRPDVHFLICTKRIERFSSCLPDDWQDGYDNVILAVTCENQQMADKRMPLLLKAKAKHKRIFASPLLEKIDFSSHLIDSHIEQISVGGESYEHARVCDFAWIQFIKSTCDSYHIEFDFHQTGSHFVMNGKHYRIKHHDEYAQAKKGMKYLK